MAQKDCSKELRSYQDKKVKLSEKKLKELKDCAKANEDRLKDGLKKSSQPMPLWFILQGSCAMRTINQDPNNNYDIDMGVCFAKEDLKGPNGAYITPLNARKMVCDALQNDMFNKAPEVRKNCVRVYYNEGYHVDIPVYRVEDPNSDSKIYELASSEWRKSGPESVTDWYNANLKAKKHVDDDENSHQMRRETRLLKKLATSRATWNFPSGFILTVLVNEAYEFNKREDIAFYNLLTKIRNRLYVSLIVYHPVIGTETLTQGDSDPRMIELRNRLDDAMNDLSVLFDGGCTKKAALKAWGKLFNDNYFEEQLEEESNSRSFSILSSNPNNPIDKQGGGMFG